jgi:hypothetical protein
MTAPASLLDDLRAIERFAAAGGAPDAFLARVVPQFVALAVGVPMSSADTFLRVLALVERERISVRLACRRVGMARSHFTELRDRWHGITGHDPCDARGNNLEEPRMTRAAKSVNIKDAGDVRPPRDSAGKPSYTPAPAPRGSGGMSTGESGGNFDAGSLELPNAIPQDAWDNKASKA